MFKKIFLLLFLINLCFAQSALSLARHLINDSAKERKLALLFKDQELKDENNKLDIEKIVQILKSNSLIRFNFSEAKELKLSFKSKAEATIFFKIMNDTLAKLGYVYYTPTMLYLNEKNISFEILIKSQYILDPAIFYSFLKKSGVYIDDIKRLSSFDYEYDLDFTKARLSPNTSLELNIEKTLSKPLEDYVFELKTAKRLKITPAINDTWYPKILFLDKNLNLVLSIENTKREKNIDLLIPKKVEYAVVGDNFDLDNIKRGLKIKLVK